MISKTFFVCKIAFSAGLLGLLLFSTDLKLLSNVLLEVDLRYFAILLTISIVSMIVSAYK